MFPPQTSFIPVTVALTKYIDANGFGGLFPYWYLGSTPVKYLIGPVVPGVLVGLHKISPQMSFFDLSFLLVVVCQLLLALGWGMLAWRLSGRRVVGVIGGIGVMILPWHWVSVLALSEVSAVVAQALTPFVLLAFARGPVSSFSHSASARLIINSERDGEDLAVRPVGSPSTTATPRGVYPDLAIAGEESYFLRLLPSLLFALLLLTNSTASIPAIVGLFILGIVSHKHWESGLKSAALVILAGGILSTLWYGPNYWLTVLGAPSIGGKAAVISFVNIINLLRSFVPVILAVLVVFWGFRPKTRFTKIACTWLGIFGILTLFRFLSDPKFWLDWTVWIEEVEVGLAILIAGIVSRSVWGDKEDLGSMGGKPGYKLTIYYLLFTIYFFVGWFFAFWQRDIWLPRKDISNCVEYKVADYLNQNVQKDELVFLSGSTAFWLNSLVDVSQVRGGRDEVSKNPYWRELNWQVTNSNNLNDALASLKALGVDFIVVHGDSSKEYYHDFKYPEKFEGTRGFEKVYEDGGDVIYKIGN